MSARAQAPRRGDTMQPRHEAKAPGAFNRGSTSRAQAAVHATTGLVLLLSATFGLAGCGKKPTPRADVASDRVASAPRVTPDVAVEAPEPVTRTLGGIELAPLVDAGPQREVILEAAMVLAENRKKGVS